MVQQFLHNRLNSKSALLIIVLITFLLYGNTLTHDYALDDAIVITENQFTKQGVGGIADHLTNDSFTGFFGKQKKLVVGGRYRPLSMVTFSLEYELFGLKPGISHFINLLIYALVAWLAFMVFSLLFKQKLPNETARITASLAALLFLIHPVHTEAVANIKGRDELLSLLFALLSLWLFIKAQGTKKILYLTIGSVSLFLGLLSKENAVSFLVIIPAAAWFFYNGTLKTALTQFGILLVPVLLFLFIRQQVLGGFTTQPTGELMNNPFVEAAGNEKLATVFYTWWVYLRLLIFPHPLTYDYYPYHIPLVGFSSPAVIGILIIIIGLLVLFFTDARKNGIYAFSILGFAASFLPVSNIIFPVGTFMNERFLFMPTLFWCFAIGYLIIMGWQKKGALKYTAIGALGFMLIFYPVKTFTRNKVWKDDFTLFTTDVQTSGNSAKSNCSAGGKLWEKAKVTPNRMQKVQYFKTSEKYLRKAIQIHPTYVDAWLLLGNLLFDSKKDVEGAVNAYLNVLNFQPQNPNAWKNIDIVLQNSDDYQYQLEVYKTLYNINKNNYQVNYRLGVLYGRHFNLLDKSIEYLENAVAINPQKVGALKDLGTAYGLAGKSEEAYKVLKQALELSPNDSQLYNNLGVACMQLGREQEAQQYFNKAGELQK